MTEGESCRGNRDGTFSAEIEGGVPPFTYELIQESAPNSASIEFRTDNPSQVFEDLSQGTYLFSYTDNVGCGQSNIPVEIIPQDRQADIDILEVTPSPTGEGDTLTFVSNVENSIFSYSWSFNQAQTSTLPVPKVFLPTGSKLWVELLLGSDNCELRADTLVYLTPSILNEVGINRIFFGPNPVQEKILLQFYLEEGSTVSISIIDMAGRVLLDSGKKQMRAGQNYLDLDVAHIPSGFYAVKFEVNDRLIEYSDQFAFPQGQENVSPNIFGKFFKL